MKKKIKSLFHVFLLACILTIAVPEIIMASDQGTNTVTRAEWLKDLVETFEMTVEDDNYPDNYFSDLDVTSDYYYDILVAVQFGVVNVEAGDPIYPAMPVTREFAASTLNHCLAFQLEDKTYTFSDAEDCIYPEDDQVAINRGWFSLISGKFMPTENISVNEAKSMLEDAHTVWHSSDVEEDYDNTYEFASDVTVLADDLNASVDAQGKLTIYDIDKKIENGDKFAVWLNGVPVVYTAWDVVTTDNITTIQTEAVDNDEAFDKLDAQGILDASALIIEPADGITTTYEEAPVPYDARMGGNINVGKNTKISVENKIKLTSSASLSHKTEITNAQIQYKLTASEVTLKFSGDVKSSYKVTGKLTGTQLNHGEEITIVPATIPGIGGLDVILDAELSGSITGNTESYTVVGFTVSQASGVRPILNFNAKQFSLVAEASAKVGVKVRLGVTGKLMPVKGYAYATAGGKAMMKAQYYTDGKPEECRTFAAWIYAEGGVKIEKENAKWSFITKTYEVKYQIFTETNSPIRAYHHYEDGKEVATCSRGNDFKYYTNTDSRYWGSGWTDGIGEYGYDANGNKVALYTYSLDDDNNATITGYKGKAANLHIPETVDGYTVVGIGAGSFAYNEVLESVEFPLTVTAIGNWAFRNCTNLRKINMPAKLQSVDTYGWNWRYPFSGCDALREIDFEEGITAIPGSIFANTGLESVIIPDTVTNIGQRAFANCKKLSYVHLSENLQSLGNYAFLNSIMLKEINVPKTLTDIDTYGWNWQYPFSGSGITSIKWTEGIKQVPYALFGECEELEQIEIPDTVTEVKERAFAGCTKLKNVNMPDSVVSIGASAFRECKAIENIDLPKQLIFIGNYAFRNCVSLKAIHIPKTLTTVDTYGLNYQCPFDNCISLEQVTFEKGISAIPDCLFGDAIGSGKGVNIVIPEGVTWIGSRCFRNFTNLKSVTLPSTIEKLYNYCFAGTGIENIVIPDGMKELSEGVFCNCQNLKEVVFPNSIEALGTYLFSGCTALTNVTLNDTRQNITSYMFQNCTSLEKISLPDSVINIVNHAFKGCTSLKEIEWGKSIKVIENNAFENCDALTDIHIPDSVTSLGSQIFYDCDALKNVTLGTGITGIPESAFEDCDVLEELVLPYRVASIGKNAFKNDVVFKKIIIPRATTQIDATAFSYPGKMTIYGVSGTYAETFAKENGISFVSNEVNAANVKLSEEQVTLLNGQSKKLLLTIEPSDFTDEVTWKSSDTNIVTVDDNGNITAKSIGMATIKVIVGSLSTSCKVTVEQPVTNIWLNKNNVTMEALETYQLTVEVYPDNASNRDVEWSSSDSDIASVDQTGKVASHKKGTATITVKSKDGSNKSQTCKVTVSNTAYVVTSVEELESSHNYMVNCSDCWVYTSEDIATDENMKVTFDERTEVEDGFDFIYIYDGNGTEVGKYTGKELAGKVIEVQGNTLRIKLVSDKAGVAWGFKVTDISATAPKQAQVISGTEYYEKVYGDTEFALDSWLQTGDGKLSYASDHTNIVSVDQNGNVSICGTGEAQIVVTASATEEYKETHKIIKIKVEKAEQKIEVNNATARIFEGQSIQLSVTSQTGKVDFTSENTNVLTVTSNGLVTAVAPGAANIKIHASGNNLYKEAVLRISMAVLEQEQDTMRELKNCDIQLSEAEFPYDGKEKRPDVSVTDEGVALIPEKDYTVYYLNNINPGTATVQIVALWGGNYTGTVSVDFEIKKEISDQEKEIGAEAFRNCSYLYNVNIKDTITRIGDRAFADCENLSEIYFYGNRPDMGNDVFQNVTATVYYPTGDSTWTLDMLKNYGGTLNWIPWNPETGEKGKRSISGCFFITNTTEIVYDGTEKLPFIIIKDGAYQLTEGKDYELTGSNNISAGNAVWNVTGIGNYEGTVSGGFIIQKAVSQTRFAFDMVEKTFEDQIFQNTVITNSDGMQSFSSSNGNIATVDQSSGTIHIHNAGTVTITAYVNESQNYRASTATFTLTVRKAPGEIVATDIIRNYNVKAQKFWIGAQAREGAKLVYSSNNKAVKVAQNGRITVDKKYMGSAQITISAEETPNYTASVRKITVTIVPKGTSISKVKNGAKKKITVTWKKNTSVTGYQIQYSTDKGFASGVKTKTVNKFKTTKVTVAGLTKGKTYYVRIRTYKKAGRVKYYSAWSKAKRVVMKK